MNSIVENKWWKIGAAAFLSVGILAACGDDRDDNDPVEDDVNLDVNVEDDNDDVKDTEVDKEDVEDKDVEVIEKDKE